MSVAYDFFLIVIYAVFFGCIKFIILLLEVILQKNNKEPALKVIFLGGVGEIGKNMTALDFGDDMIIIDCGDTCPGGDMPGVDLVIPDFTYLVNNREKVRGLVLTHGHEDHIGAVPYFLKELNVPIYGTRITLALLENKLREHKLENVKMNVVKPRSVISLGKNFRVEFVNVSHSIAGSCALAITTPVGVVFHSGDFKISARVKSSVGNSKNFPIPIKSLIAICSKSLILSTPATATPTFLQARTNSSTKALRR